MHVGELIDLLQQYRGRGDEVTIYNSELDENLTITEVEWDPYTQTVQITARLPRGTYPEMIVPESPYVEIAKAYLNPICGVPDCRDEHPDSEVELENPGYPPEILDFCWLNDCGCDGDPHP